MEPLRHDTVRLKLQWCTEDLVVEELTSQFVVIPLESIFYNLSIIIDSSKGRWVVWYLFCSIRSMRQKHALLWRLRVLRLYNDPRVIYHLELHEIGFHWRTDTNSIRKTNTSAHFSDVQLRLTSPNISRSHHRRLGSPSQLANEAIVMIGRSCICTKLCGSG